MGVAGPEDVLAGIEHAAAVGADYCEFDVRRCADGGLSFHPAPALPPDQGGDPVKGLTWPDLPRRAPEVLRLEQLLEPLAAHGLGAHVDAKYETSARARREGQSWEAELISALV